MGILKFWRSILIEEKIYSGKIKRSFEFPHSNPTVSSFQADSESSRSGSSLSLRNMPGSGNTGASSGGTSLAAPASAGPHSQSGRSGAAGSSSGDHRGVQRSISATSSKQRRGSAGAEFNCAPPSAAPPPEDLGLAELAEALPAAQAEHPSAAQEKPFPTVVVSGIILQKLEKSNIFVTNFARKSLPDLAKWRSILWCFFPIRNY